MALVLGPRRVGPCRLRLRTVRSTPKAEDVVKLDCPVTEATVLSHAELPADSDNADDDNA